ncbi:MAG: hypothetical protein FD173_194 [Gallionellaceae bacterium]|nr:MAG: hypothetical protein FD173_194 [Gallionellaceae bacterium]
MKSPHNSTELLSEMIGLIYERVADLSLGPQLFENMSGLNYFVANRTD